MASLYRKPCVDFMREDGESGYQSDGYWNKYAERLDACDFFAGCGKKNGEVDFCAIAYCYWLFMNVITDDGEPDDDDRKYMTHYAMYQSDDCCTSAGCEQQAQAYKNAGAWYEDPKDLCTGAQIFFQKWDSEKGRYVYYHTGGCIDWDENGIYTTEANVEGGKTKKRFYPYSDFGGKIAGYGLPRFDGYEAETGAENPEKENNKPTPAEPSDETPGAKNELYRVNVNYNFTETAPAEVFAALRLRSRPQESAAVLALIPDGDTVKVEQTTDGWAKITYGPCIGWACLDYLVEF